MNLDSKTNIVSCSTSPVKCRLSGTGRSLPAHGVVCNNPVGSAPPSKVRKLNGSESEADQCQHVESRPNRWMDLEVVVKSGGQEELGTASTSYSIQTQYTDGYFDKAIDAHRSAATEIARRYSDLYGASECPLARALSAPVHFAKDHMYRPLIANKIALLVDTPNYRAKALELFVKHGYEQVMLWKRWDASFTSVFYAKLKVVFTKRTISLDFSHLHDFIPPRSGFRLEKKERLHMSLAYVGQFEANEQHLVDAIVKDVQQIVDDFDQLHGLDGYMIFSFDKKFGNLSNTVRGDSDGLCAYVYSRLKAIPGERSEGNADSIRTKYGELEPCFGIVGAQSGTPHSAIYRNPRKQ